jgi:hypothetical protein
LALLTARVRLRLPDAFPFFVRAFFERGFFDDFVLRAALFLDFDLAGALRFLANDRDFERFAVFLTLLPTLRTALWLFLTAFLERVFGRSDFGVALGF